MPITLLSFNRSILQKTFLRVTSASPDGYALYNDTITFNIFIDAQDVSVLPPNFGYVKVYDSITNEIWGDGYISRDGYAVINKTLDNIAGVYELIVEYDGYNYDPSATYDGSKSNIIPYIISGGNVVTTTTLSIGDPVFAPNIDKTVVVNVAGGGIFPEGTVTVEISVVDEVNNVQTEYVTGTLVPGIFPYSTATIIIPADTITIDGYWSLVAIYSGDNIYLNPGESTPVIATVTSYLSDVVLTLSGPLVAIDCEDVTYDISAASRYGTVDGNITLYATSDYTAILATGVLSGGTVSLLVTNDAWSPTFSGGVFSVYATCTGSESFADSTSNALDVDVTACGP